jgi:hypothetical protein
MTSIMSGDTESDKVPRDNKGSGGPPTLWISIN